MAESTKALLMLPGIPPHYFDYNDETKEKIFGDKEYSTFPLFLRNSNLELELTCLDSFDQTMLNKLGSTYVNHLFQKKGITNTKIYGPVVITNKNGNMDDAVKQVMDDTVTHKKVIATQKKKARRFANKRKVFKSG